MSERPAPVDLLDFVGERGRQYVLSEPTTPAPDADVLELAGDPDRRYVTAAASSGRQRAWLVCVLLLALGLPALVVTYGYNRSAGTAEAAAAPATTESSLLDTTSESRVTTESTVRRTTSTTEAPTTSSTEAPTTSSTAYVTSTTAYVAPTTTALAVTGRAGPARAHHDRRRRPPRPPPTSRRRRPRRPPPAKPPSWRACAMRESGGNYGAVSPDGLYRGAYQFHAATWNNVASMAGRPDLVGVLRQPRQPRRPGPAGRDALPGRRPRTVGRRLRLSPRRLRRVAPARRRGEADRVTFSPASSTRSSSSTGSSPSRALGQNFVADPNTVRRIARLADVGPGDRVVEIGAGLGSLTLALAETGAAVTAVEIDRHLRTGAAVGGRAGRA